MLRIDGGAWFESRQEPTLLCEVFVIFLRSCNKSETVPPVSHDRCVPFYYHALFRTYVTTSWLKRALKYGRTPKTVFYINFIWKIQLKLFTIMHVLYMVLETSSTHPIFHLSQGTILWLVLGSTGLFYDIITAWTTGVFFPVRQDFCENYCTERLWRPVSLLSMGIGNVRPVDKAVGLWR